MTVVDGLTLWHQIGLLINLRILDVGSTQLSALPSTLLLLTALETLDLRVISTLNMSDPITSQVLQTLQLTAIVLT